MGKPSLIRKAAAAAAIAGLSAPAIAADQFDLVCTAKDASKHYRVDLVSMQWCTGDCSNLRKIANVSPTLIEFVDKKPAFAGDDTASEFVKRTTGEWFEFWRSSALLGGRASTFTQGKCEAAPFSGINPPATKF